MLVDVELDTANKVFLPARLLSPLLGLCLSSPGAAFILVLAR